MRNILRCLWGYLDRRRRIQLCFLLLVMVLSGVAELVTLGAVLPFLAVLSDPETIWRQPWVQSFAIRMSFTNANELLLPVTSVFALAATIAGLIRLINIWLNGRLAAEIGSDLSCEAYKRTLYQPYSVHVQRNSSEVIVAITTQISLTIEALKSLLQLIAASIISFGLIIGLLLIDALAALGTAIVFSSLYAIIANTSRRELRHNSYKIAESTKRQLKALQEGLGAIRDVLLDGNQHTYLQIYKQADRPQRRLQAKNAFIAVFPRFALEAVAMVSIAFLGVFLVVHNGSGSTVIPLLGALALGAQRLLPALQQIYSGWATFKGCNSAIQSVLDMLDQPLPPLDIVAKPLHFSDRISLKGVHFSYGAGCQHVLKGLDIDIFPGECVGLIGSTGSGKSTTLDILMGLLTPTSGQLLIDGINLHDQHYPERLLSWRSTIAHVPQNIYLADGSIAENIAFGIPRAKINFSRVRYAAKQAKINTFIESINDGYDTFVGERGIRLSGGQRQRIGIARALYKKSKVLVLDEATSALDNDTEEAVMESIEELSSELTIIIIAHRLSTVQRCDRVIRLEKGTIFNIGTPDQIISDQNFLT